MTYAAGPRAQELSPAAPGPRSGGHAEPSLPGSLCEAASPMLPLLQLFRELGLGEGGGAARRHVLCDSSLCGAVDAECAVGRGGRHGVDEAASSSIVARTVAHCSGHPGALSGATVLHLPRGRKTSGLTASGSASAPIASAMGTRTLVPACVPGSGVIHAT